MTLHPLKEWRAQNGHSRSYIAGRLGCTTATVYNWETFASVPTSKAMAKLVHLTGLSPTDFYPPPAKNRKRA